MLDEEKNPAAAADTETQAEAMSEDLPVPEDQGEDVAGGGFVMLKAFDGKAMLKRQ